MGKINEDKLYTLDDLKKSFEDGRKTFSWCTMSG